MVSKESLFLEGKLKTQEKSWKPQGVKKKKKKNLPKLLWPVTSASLGGGGTTNDKTQGHLHHMWSLVLRGERRC